MDHVNFSNSDIREMDTFNAISDFIVRLVAQNRLAEADAIATIAVIFDQMHLSVAQVEYVADRYQKIEFMMTAFKAVGYPYE